MTRPTFVTPFASELLTFGNSTPVGCTAATYAANGTIACWAEGVVEGSVMRLKLVGTVTSAEGTPIQVGQSVLLKNADEIRLFRGISQTSTNSTIFMHYWKHAGGQ